MKESKIATRTKIKIKPTRISTIKTTKITNMKTTKITTITTTTSNDKK